MGAEPHGTWRIEGALATLLVALAGYGLLGPPGLAPRGPVPDLPEPAKVLDATGAPRAAVDGVAWRAALEAAGLPELHDPSGLEHEPVARLVARSRDFTRRGDADALGRMGEVMLALGLDRDATGLFLAARELGRDAARWEYLVGVALQSAGDLVAARVALERAAALQPDYGVTHARLGAIHLEEGRLDEADAAFARGAAQGPSPAASLVGRARVALARGDAAAALAFADDAAQRTPRDYQAHRARASALARLGRTAESDEAARMAATLPQYKGWLSHDPRLAALDAASGTTLSLERALDVALQSGDLATAAATGDALVRVAPGSVDILRTVASIHANRGQLTRAAELAKRAVELAPDDISTLSTCAEIAIAAGDAATMDAVTSRLLERDRGRAASWALVGRARFVGGRHADALDAVERAESLAPRDESLPLLRAEMLRQLGRLDEANAVLDAALGRDPSFAEVRRVRAAATGR